MYPWNIQKIIVLLSKNSAHKWQSKMFFLRWLQENRRGYTTKECKEDKNISISGNYVGDIKKCEKIQLKEFKFSLFFGIYFYEYSSDFTS